MTRKDELLSVVNTVIIMGKNHGAERLTLSWEQFTASSTAPVLHHAITITYRKSPDGGNEEGEPDGR